MLFVLDIFAEQLADLLHEVMQHNALKILIICLLLMRKIHCISPDSILV